MNLRHWGSISGAPLQIGVKRNKGRWCSDTDEVVVVVGEALGGSCKHTAPPPPPCCPMNHPLLPFHTACLQLSHGSSVAGFGPTSHPHLTFQQLSCRFWPSHHYHHLVRTTVPPYAPSYTLSPTAIPHSAPTTKPRQFSCGF